MKEVSLPKIAPVEMAQLLPFVPDDTREKWQRIGRMRRQLAEAQSEDELDFGREDIPELKEEEREHFRRASIMLLFQQIIPSADPGELMRGWDMLGRIMSDEIYPRRTAMYKVREWLAKRIQPKS